MRVLVIVVIEGDVVTLWVGHGEFDHVETVAIADRAVNGRSSDADGSSLPRDHSPRSTDQRLSNRARAALASKSCLMRYAAMHLQTQPSLVSYNLRVAADRIR